PQLENFYVEKKRNLFSTISKELIMYLQIIAFSLLLMICADQRGAILLNSLNTNRTSSLSVIASSREAIPEKIIIPGQRVGKIEIGATRQATHKVLGAPISSRLGEKQN